MDTLKLSPLCVLFFFPFTASLFAAQPDEAWTKMFDRTSGWSGADGIFTIRDDVSSNTFFLFSDTLIGDVNPQTGSRSNTKMVNHSFAVLEGNEPNPEKIRFFYPGDGHSVGLPLTPRTPGQWYWLSDGFLVRNADSAYLYVFLLRMEKAGQGGAFGFRHLGVDMARFAVKDGEIDFASAKILEDDPENPRLGVYSPETLTFGSGVSADADGYIYVYGFRQKRGGPRMLTAARFLPENTENFKEWRYFAGDGQWSENFQDTAGITGNVSPELSVTPMAGKYALIYTPGTIGSKIAMRLGDSPVGPFGEERILYEESVTKEIGHGAFAYNAKAHPAISPAGELIITYNVNSNDNEMRIFRFGGIYRPRFIRVRTEDF